MKKTGTVKFVNEIDIGKNDQNYIGFLEKLFTKFVKKSKAYFDVTGELPYIYRERQLHSIIVPILDSISDAILVECPTSRKYRGYDPSHGWIDYWVKYGNTIFLIELKHSYHGLKSQKLREQSVKEWNTANDQLKQVSNRDLPDFKVDENDIVVKMALQFNVTYTTASKKTFSMEECDDIGENILMKSFGKKLKPNFLASWFVPEEMQKEFYWDSSDEKYPYLHMFARLEPEK
jgi:hypothetical protein